SRLSICDVTGYVVVPYIDWLSSALGMKLTMPNTSMIRNGTLTNTPTLSKRSCWTNCRKVVAVPNTGCTRGGRATDGRDADASIGAGTAAAPLRRHQRRPVPVRSVRNNANTAANIASDTGIQSARLDAR